MIQKIKRLVFGRYLDWDKYKLRIKTLSQISRLQ